MNLYTTGEDKMKGTAKRFAIVFISSFIFSFFFLFSVSAELQIGLPGNSEEIGINIVPDPIYGNITNYYNVTNINQTNYIEGNQTFNQSLTDAKYIWQVEEPNLNVNSSSWWAGLNNYVAGWFVKTGTSLGFNETKLTSFIGGSFVKKSGDTMTGDLIITQNNSIILGNINPRIKDNKILSEGGFASYGGYWGKNTGKEPYFKMYSSDATKIKEGTTGSFNSATNVFCDYTADNFEASDASRPTKVLTVFNSTYEGAIAEISSFLNSSCIVLEKNPGWDSGFSGYVWEIRTGLKINFNDGEAYKFVVGNHEESLFKIGIPNGTGSKGVYIYDAAGIDNHKALKIDVDSKDYDGVVGANIFMSSSTGVDGISSDAISLEGDATGFNNSLLHFIDISLLGQGSGNDVDVIHIQGLPDDGHILHLGSLNDIDRAYYDNGAGTTVDATTAFTSQSTDVTLFENDNSIIYIGNDMNFTSIGISLSTEGNKNILAEYYYCDGSGTWKELTGVVDTTGGFTTSGTIGFVNPSDRGLCNEEIDSTAFADATNHNYIAVKRTRTAYPGQKPVENLFSISGGGEYLYMDKYGLKPIGSAGAPYTCDQTRFGHAYTDSVSISKLWCDGSSWQEYATTTDVTTHNNLGGLQGGQATEYYHLEAGEYSETTDWLAAVTLGDDGNITQDSNGWFKGLFNWSTISSYLSFDGANLDFNETLLNNTIDNRAASFNDSLASYVDGQDSSYNASMKIYVDAVNSSQSSWVDSVFLKIANMFSKSDITGMVSGNVSAVRDDIDSNWTDLETRKLNVSDQRFNESSYSDARDVVFNDSMKNYVDARDVVFNDSVKGYVDSQDSSYNSSMKNYVDVVNSSHSSWINTIFLKITDMFSKSDITGMVSGNISDVREDINSNWTDLENRKLNVSDQRFNESSYADSQDSSYNASIYAYVNSQDSSFNTSMKNYVDARDVVFNDSVASYVDVQDLAFNVSAGAYTDSLIGSVNTTVNIESLLVSANAVVSNLNVTNTLRVGNNFISSDATGLNISGGDVNFGGSWTDGGVTLSRGDIFAQGLYVYNITSLGVSTLNINGSLIPATGFDNTFDIGSTSLRWKDLHLGGEVFSNGTGDNYFRGNVGIGTTSPATDLHIYSDENTQLRLQTLANSSAFLLFQAGAVEIGRFQYNGGSVATDPFHVILKAKNSNGVIDFEIRNDRQMYIDRNRINMSKPLYVSNSLIAGSDNVEVLNNLTVNERVGIGTDSPTHKLNVVGDLNVTGTSYLGDLVFSSDEITVGTIWAKDEILNLNNSLYVNSSDGNVGIGTNSPKGLLQVGNGTDSPSIGADIYLGKASPDMIIRDTDNDVEARFSVFSSGAIYGTVTNDDLFFRTNNLNRIVIENSGNVGIGTATPASTLEVEGTIKAGNVNDATINNFQIETEMSNDYAGIRAYSSDSSKYGNIIAAGSGASASLLAAGTTEAGSYLGISRADSGSLVFVGGHSNILNYHEEDMYFGTNNILAMTIDGSTQNVGIGTDSPDTNLHVKSAAATLSKVEVTDTDSYAVISAESNGGDIRLGTWGTTAVGTSAGNAIADTSALFTVGGDLTIQTYNDNNLIFGQNDAEVMRIDTNGNVGIGTKTPASTLDVNGSITVFGDIKTDASTTNTFLGVGAGELVDGYDTNNVAIGNNALSSLDPGDLNVAIGYNALKNFTGAGYNTVIGANAMESATSAWLNVAIGKGAMVKHLNGDDNVAVGVGALSGSTGGHSNIAVGRQAGDTITTGDNNIIIGDRVTVVYPHVNGLLNIGNLIYGTGLTGVAGSTPVSGNVGIGTNAPTYKLHIADSTDSTQSTFYGTGLKIESDTLARIYFEDTGAGVNEKLFALQTSSGLTKFASFNDTGSSLNNAILVMNHTSGFVGLGTTTPNFTLDVVGDIYATGSITQGSSAKLKTNIEEQSISTFDYSNIKQQKWNYVDKKPVFETQQKEKDKDVCVEEVKKEAEEECSISSETNETSCITIPAEYKTTCHTEKEYYNETIQVGTQNVTRTSINYGFMVDDTPLKCRKGMGYDIVCLLTDFIPNRVAKDKAQDDRMEMLETENIAMKISLCKLGATKWC